MSTQLLPACHQNKSDLLKCQLQPEHEFLSLQEYQEKKSHQGYQFSLLFVFIFLVQLLFSLEVLIPPILFGFDWACFFYCSPSSHFVFSILSLEAMSRPAAGTPLSLIGPTAALSLQLTLRPLNISMFQVGAGTVCVSVSCHSVECSLCNFVLSPLFHTVYHGVHLQRLELLGLELLGFLRGVVSSGMGAVNCDFYLFCWSGVRMPWVSGSVDGLWAGYELPSARFFSQFHQLSTGITPLTLEELVLIHSDTQKRVDQWAITYVVHSDCCDLFQSWTKQF